MNPTLCGRWREFGGWVIKRRFRALLGRSAEGPSHSMPDADIIPMNATAKPTWQLGYRFGHFSMVDTRKSATDVVCA
ncbi:hypothetical protein [Jannaschia faecimaris]|uniref:hypothetical protein n=1 Tax=Jannaschia faecimaris TaxID=1244108 RepID=UPI001113C091|nr:hypothetical protein [Jannaschia faecimaris]